jgi:PAS domain S-box-containing protein
LELLAYLLYIGNYNDFFSKIGVLLMVHVVDSTKGENQEEIMSGQWEWNITKNTLYRSRKLLEILGIDEKSEFYDLEDTLKRIHSDDVSFVREEIQKAIKNKSSYYLEYRYIRPSGKEIILQEYGNIALDEAGNVISIGGSIIDITFRRRANKALWKTEYKLAVAHKIAGLVSWEYDPATKLIDWSEGVYELLGAEPRTIESFFTYIHPNDLNFVKDIGKSSNEGAPYNIEYRIIKVDGTQINVYEQAEVFFDANGNVERKIGTIQDITERKNTEERLQNSEKLSVVGQLAAGVAHEIRNPLTSLRGFIQLLQAGMQGKEYYTIMLDELDRIEFIVSEFLNLAKPQAVTYEKNHPIELLNDVIILLKTETNLNNIAIVESFQDNIPCIYCEKNQIKQVLINIFKNAIESMHNGGKITVSTRLSSFNDLVICIKDQGVGIPTSRLEKLGEPFYSTKEKGTGLGLMICQKIIESHGGKITYESIENKGTTVTINLPINEQKRR